MNPQELRIKNYIYDIEESKYYQIEEICKLSEDSKNQNLGVRYRNGSFWSDISFIKPIKLTDEILLKCGFDKFDTIGGCFFYNKIGIRIDYILGKFVLLGYDRCKLNYLHELQNLTYCLTNEELEINL